MTITSSGGSPAPQSFRKWRQGDSLDVVMGRAESAVRSRPLDRQARWLLFELLCIQGAWERALKQLQTCASMDPSLQGTAQAMRGLIRAELQRHEVFAGRQSPVPVAEMPAWASGLVRAISLNASGVHDAADEVRAEALAAAPDTAGQGNLGAFRWLSDTDTRLGPICELVTAGSYRWIPFSDMRSLTLVEPRSLLDQVWGSAQVELHGGVTLRAFIPARYSERPVDANAPRAKDGAAGRTDALRMGRETVWREVGITGVFGHGQKTWMTDAGDWPLLDVRECRFHDADAGGRTL